MVFVPSVGGRMTGYRRTMSAVLASVVLVCAASGLPAQAAVPGLQREAAPTAGTAQTLVVVPLKPAWKVKTASQLRLSGAHLRCSVSSLARSGAKGATAALVMCAGPAGGTYRMTVTVRGNRAAKVPVMVTLSGSPTEAAGVTVDQVLAVAPLGFSIGTEANNNGVTFQIPENWSRTDGANAVKLSATSSRGMTCDVYIMNPITPSGDTSLWGQQLIDITRTVFAAGTSITGEFGASTPVFNEVSTGRTGMGYGYLELHLSAGDFPYSTTVFPYLVTTSATTAIPVVQVGDGCTGAGDLVADTALIKMSIDANGSTPDGTSYQQTIVGSWFANGGSAGGLSIYGANGHYVASFGSSTEKVSGGVIYDVTSTWAGDGIYRLAGPLLVTVPKSARPFSEFILMYRTTWADGTVRDYLCSLAGNGGQRVYGCSMKQD
jgi:hypothetical protein